MRPSESINSMSYGLPRVIDIVNCEENLGIRDSIAIKVYPKWKVNIDISLR